MSDTTIATLEASVADAKTQAEAAGGTDDALNKAVTEAETALSTAKAALSQDPLETALADAKNKKDIKKRTELEKAEFAKQQIEKRIADLRKGDGSIAAPLDDDDAPVTRRDLKKMEADRAQKTALEMTDAITDPKEKELVKYHLENSIKSTGKAEDDLKLALSIVYSTKNSQVAEEMARAIPSKTPSFGGAPPRREDSNFEPTPAEMGFMRPPFNMTKAEIIANRKKER